MLAETPGTRTVAVTLILLAFAASMQLFRR
jgi:hypothetical protein